MCISTLTYLPSCGHSLARSISILWIRPRRPTAFRRPRRWRAKYFPVLGDMRLTVPRELIYFLKTSLEFRERQRARSYSVFYRIDQPNSAASSRETSTRRHFTSLCSGMMGAAYRDRTEVEFQSCALRAMKASSVLSTTSVTRNPTRFLDGLWLRLRPISRPFSRAKQVVSIYIQTQGLEEVSLAGTRGTAGSVVMDFTRCNCFRDVRLGALGCREFRSRGYASLGGTVHIYKLSSHSSLGTRSKGLTGMPTGP